jgi:hypothetical protein
VNQAGAQLIADPDRAGYKVIEIKTEAATNNQPGGFNDVNATGNRALLGVAVAPLTSFSQLLPLSYNVKIEQSTLNVSALVAIDLNCDASNIQWLQVNGDSITPTSADRGYSQYKAGLHDDVWQVSGSAIVDPNNSSNILVHSINSGYTSDLSALLTAYPNACVPNTVQLDPGLPLNLPTAPVLLSLGGTSNYMANSVLIDDIEVGSQVSAKDWQ